MHDITKHQQDEQQSPIRSEYNPGMIHQMSTSLAVLSMDLACVSKGEVFLHCGPEKNYSQTFSGRSRNATAWPVLKLESSACCASYDDAQAAQRGSWMQQSCLGMIRSFKRFPIWFAAAWLVRFSSRPSLTKDQGSLYGVSRSAIRSLPSSPATLSNSFPVSIPRSILSQE